MQQYHDLIRHIIEHGTARGDRTGTGTISIFGHQMRFDLTDGKFPLVTTKKVFLRGVIEELLWFLSGSTDNNKLVEKGVHIWDEWALKEDRGLEMTLSNLQRASEYALMNPHLSLQEIAKTLNDLGVAGGHEFLDAAGIPRTRKLTTHPKGSVGPIYGQQWRSWRCPDGSTVDQIAEVIKNLKEKPYSRRHVVTAWNPADLPDESISPQENVVKGRQSLASCHCLFQFFVAPMTVVERIRHYQSNGGVCDVLEGLFRQYTMELADANTGIEAARLSDAVNAKAIAYLDEHGVPGKKLSCHLNLRSSDVGLGLPFNIASYALLTAMVAQVTEMVPNELIVSTGDTHIYSNHVEALKQQLTRAPHKSPTLRLNKEIMDIDAFTSDDIHVEGYHPHPPIKMAVSK